MDAWQIVILLILLFGMAVFVGLLVLAALYLGRTGSRNQPESQFSQSPPRVLPPPAPPLPQPPASIQIEASLPPTAAGKIRWGDEPPSAASAAMPSAAADRLNSGCFPRCPVCRHPLLPEQTQAGQTTFCRHCDTPYHITCFEYIHSTCSICGRT